MSNPINDRYIKVSQPQAESERALKNEDTMTILIMTLLKITILKHLIRVTLHIVALLI
jgi:hypothetical protein